MVGFSLSEKEDYDGYIVEVSLPFIFSNEISETLASESSKFKERLSKNNIYMKLDEDDTLNLLLSLHLDPFEPELPALLLFDKHPKEANGKDKGVLIKLGAMKNVQDIPIVLEKVCELVNKKRFIESSSSDRKKKLSDSLKEVPNVNISIVSPFIS